MKTSWGANETVVNSRGDLEVVIDSVRTSRQPTMVFLEAENGSILVFGIGQDESVLTFVQPDGTSFHSLGDRDRSGDLHFLCRDQVEEFLAEMAVPERNAVDAAGHFLATCERPPGIQWEADW